jgi:chromosome segregation ATPase
LSKEKDREKFELATESLVDEHHKHCTKLENHRDRLANEATAMRESIQRKDNSREVLEDQQAQMQAEVAKLKEDLNSSNTFGREERQKYLELERDFKAAEGEIDQLKADFRHRESEINKLRESKLSLEKRHNDIRQSLQSSDEELERLRGLAVELRTEPLATT